MSDESTTSDLVELTRRSYEVATRGDLDALVSFYTCDVVYDVSDAGLGTFEGARAVRGFFEDWWASYDEYATEVEEILDFGHGVVFSAYRENVRLAGSDGTLEQRRAFVSMWASSKVEWMKSYLDIDEARAAGERLARERG
jgi:ketosteroid isomerase-like protein